MAKSKSVVVFTLILSLIFMGVFYNERPTVQTSTDTGYDTGSWYFGSRSIKPTPKDNRQNVGTGRSKAMGENDGRSPEQLADGSDTASGQFSKMESSVIASTLGAGCVYDITVRPGYRYYTAEELEKGLLHDLKPLTTYFIQAQETYGVDAVFLAAVSAEESGWGRHQFRKNNIFGFENCDFDNLEQCIDYAAKWLKDEYLTPGGMYYEGVCVADINKHYNGRPEWEAHVTAIMGQIVNRIERNDAE